MFIYKFKFWQIGVLLILFRPKKCSVKQKLSFDQQFRIRKAIFKTGLNINEIVNLGFEVFWWYYNLSLFKNIKTEPKIWDEIEWTIVNQRWVSFCQICMANNFWVTDRFFNACHCFTGRIVTDVDITNLKFTVSDY